VTKGRSFVGIALLAGIGCATSPPGPLPKLPPPVDVGTLLEPAPAAPEIPPHVARYDDVRVRKGACPGLPAGILLSPAVYAEQTWALAERKRLRLELAALTRLRSEERAAAEALEQAYQARFSAMAQQDRLLTWRMVTVLGVGVLLGGLTALASWPPARRAM
jgi:hypothetical protein